MYFKRQVLGPQWENVSIFNVNQSGLQICLFVFVDDNELVYHAGGLIVEFLHSIYILHPPQTFGHTDRDNLLWMEMYFYQLGLSSDWRTDMLLIIQCGVLFRIAAAVKSAPQ